MQNNQTKVTPSNSEIISGQNVGTKVNCGMILVFEKKIIPQTTFVLTFWPLIISELDGVWKVRKKFGNRMLFYLIDWGFSGVMN